MKIKIVSNRNPRNISANRILYGKKELLRVLRLKVQILKRLLLLLRKLKIFYHLFTLAISDNSLIILESYSLEPDCFIENQLSSYPIKPLTGLFLYFGVLALAEKMAINVEIGDIVCKVSYLKKLSIISLAVFSSRKSVSLLIAFEVDSMFLVVSSIPFSKQYLITNTFKRSSIFI